MTHVFIAYSHQNIEFARRIEADLRRDHCVWRDESAGVLGDNWKREVTMALDIASVIVVIVSPDSVHSENVDFEVEYALQKGVPIVGIQYKRCETASTLEHLQLIDDAIEFIFVDESQLDEESYQQTFGKLTKAIEQSQRLMGFLGQLAGLDRGMNKMISRWNRTIGSAFRLARAIKTVVPDDVVFLRSNGVGHRFVHADLARQRELSGLQNLTALLGRIRDHGRSNNLSKSGDGSKL